MPAGGARPGSGRKKGSLFPKTMQKLTEAELLRESLRPHVADVARALIAQALTGDTSAIKEVFERVAGKATVPIEVTQKQLLPLTPEQEERINRLLYDGNQQAGA